MHLHFLPNYFLKSADDGENEVTQKSPSLAFISASLKTQLLFEIFDATDAKKKDLSCVGMSFVPIQIP